MDKKNYLNNSEKKEIITNNSQKKDWVKVLEEISGKPFEPYGPVKIVYLIVDCSGSMAESNKMEQAKRGAYGFAENAQKKDYYVGLIQFASDADHIIDPQIDVKILNGYLEKMVAGGSTNMAAAIRLVVDKFEGKLGEKVICIITDGMPDDRKAALDVANDARTKGIDIMTIGTDDADKAFLEKLATRKDLSLKVSRDRLEHGIVSMAKMLPEKNE